jgi:hypothetical protein
MEVAAASTETERLATIEAMALFAGVAPPANKTVAYESVPGTVDHDGCLRLVVGEQPEPLALPDGLSLAGPSSFPRMGAANPTLTTLALGFEMADTFHR